MAYVSFLLCVTCWHCKMTFISGPETTGLTIAFLTLTPIRTVLHAVSFSVMWSVIEVVAMKYFDEYLIVLFFRVGYW